MFLESITWDDAAATATLTLRERDPIPGPEGGAAWWPGPGASVTITVPIRRATTTDPTGIQVTSGAGGVVEYTKYEYADGAWASVGRVDADGSPYSEAK